MVLIEREKTPSEKVEGLEVDGIVPSAKLKELFNEREILDFWGFVQKLKENNWSKFGVSWAKFPFSKDEEILFFEVGEKSKKAEAYDIKFLGIGKVPGTTEIGNQFAATTWGFAVLNLKENDTKN